MKLSRGYCSNFIGESRNLMNRPYMLTQARFHRRSNTQRLMHSAKVVVHVEQRNHGDVVFELFAERVGQASEAAIGHPQIEILAFHKNWLDMCF